MSGNEREEDTRKEIGADAREKVVFFFHFRFVCLLWVFLPLSKMACLA